MPELTIVSWNVENLARHVAEVPAFLARLGHPDVLCLQEARIRPQDPELVAAMVAAAPGYACHFSLSRDPRNVTFRGGRMYGVVTYVRESLGTLHAEVPAWDREGRVVFSLVTTPGLRPLVIGNVYAVNGTDKPYFDHERGEVWGDRHAFKRRFQEQVLVRAAALRAEADVVVTGDWNVSQTKQDITPRLRTEEPHALARAQLADHLASTGMVDVFRRLHPDARKYTWFNRRARRLDAARVDFALVSEELLPDVLEADVWEDEALREPSDHAPLMVRLARR